MAAPLYPEVTLAILAGGASRRLGGLPKGLITLEGQSVLSRLLSLAPSFARVLLATSTPAVYQGYGLFAVPDPIPGKGAPGGLLGALEAASTPWVLAVAIDMPFVTPAVVARLLLARAPELEAVCFEVQHRLEPLLALYRTTLGSRLRLALSDRPSLTDLLRSARTAVLSEQALAQVDPDLRSVVSVNTAEQAAALGARLP